MQLGSDRHGHRQMGICPFQNLWACTHHPAFAYLETGTGRVVVFTNVPYGMPYRMTFGFLAEKIQKTKIIQNFMLNQTLFYHFPEKTC